MTKRLLHGDSVIGNRSYVGSDQPDVFPQILKRASGTVTMRAVDRDRIDDAMQRLDIQPLPNGVPIAFRLGWVR